NQASLRGRGTFYHCTTVKIATPREISLGRTWRGTPAPDAAILRALLQRNQNAPIVEQRCATHTPGSAEWTHRVACYSRRATSPICSNLSFRHTQGRPDAHVKPCQASGSAYTV